MVIFHSYVSLPEGIYGVFSSSPFSPWVTHGVYPSFRKIAISVSPFAILYLLLHTWLRLVWKIAQVPGVLVIWGMTHDRSMVLLYMVLHGSHQYTPVMLALIYQHHGSYGWCHDSIPKKSFNPWAPGPSGLRFPSFARVFGGPATHSRKHQRMDLWYLDAIGVLETVVFHGYLWIFDIWPNISNFSVCLKWVFFGNIPSSMVLRKWW